MTDAPWQEPPTIPLLQWLARGSLKQNLLQAIRLWVWLRLLYGCSDDQLALPAPFAYADWLHRTQTRKVRPVPYMAHLMAVSSLVLEDGGGEDEAIAALLHDAIEDQGGASIRVAINNRYGPYIANLVDACTEPPRAIDQSWQDHKLAYLHQVNQASLEAQRIVLADKLHNLRSLLVNLHLLGDVIWQEFTADKASYLWFYSAIANTLCCNNPSLLANTLFFETERLLCHPSK